MGCLTVSDLGELELVERILGKLSTLNSDVQIGPGDDAAVLSIGGSVVLTTDSQHEGIHYCAEWIAPEVLGRRAIAVNASDLGAMGARPRGFLVALALPASTELDWVVSLAEGLREGAERFGASILGGDVAAVANRVSINVTALGEIEEGTDPVERGGAAEGTWCFVTGWPGRAAAARRMFKTGYRSSAAFEPCIDAFLDPRPPVAFGGCVASQGLVGAMIDISDGLAVEDVLDQDKTILAVAINLLGTQHFCTPRLGPATATTDCRGNQAAVRPARWSAPGPGRHCLT